MAWVLVKYVECNMHRATLKLSRWVDAQKSWQPRRRGCMAFGHCHECLCLPGLVVVTAAGGTGRGRTRQLPWPPRRHYQLANSCPLRSVLAAGPPSIDGAPFPMWTTCTQIKRLPECTTSPFQIKIKGLPFRANWYNCSNSIITKIYLTHYNNHD